MTMIYLARVQCDRCGDRTPVYGSPAAAREGASAAWCWVQTAEGADLCTYCAAAVLESSERITVTARCRTCNHPFDDAGACDCQRRAAR